MVDYRRNKPDSPDTLFFLTIVTFERRKLFHLEKDFQYVKDEMIRVSKGYRVKFMAWVILSDHMHWLIKPGKANYSKVITSFKRGIGAEYKRRGIIQIGDKLWQDRFWEHTIRDDRDYSNCVDYIHFNPVKHGLATSPSEWKYSSFTKHVDKGLIESDWAKGDNIIIPGAEYD